MREVKEQMKIILRKKARYRTRKQIRRLAGTGAGLTALLVAAIVFVPGMHIGRETGGPSTLGSTILGTEFGGYVIVALLAFTIGIITAIITE